MRNNLILTFVLLIATLSACKSDITQTDDFGGIILNAPLHDGKPSDKPRRADVVASIDTIQLQGSVQESFIDHVSDIRMTSDMIFVLSADVINIFDHDGRHLRKIQRKGRGPGEYITLTAFDILEEQKLLYVLDQQYQQIIIYDYDGRHVRTIHFDSWGVYDFAVLPSGHLLLLQLMDERSKTRGLYEIDENGQFVRQLFALPQEYNHIVYGSKFLTHISDSVTGCLGLEDNDYIYHYQNDTLVPVYKVKTDIVMPDYVMQGQRPLPPDEAYSKIQYWETPRFMGFTLVSEDLFTIVMYDHKTGQQTNYYKDELMTPHTELDFVPTFNLCYKNKLIIVHEAEDILQYEPLQKDFAGITLDSNPVLVIIKLKE